MGKLKKTYTKMKLFFLILLLGVVYTNSFDRELQALIPKCNLSKNGRCGPQFGNTICPSGYCSQWWWCGTSALHKSTHQAKYDAKPACAAKKAVKKVVKKAAKKVVKKPKVKVTLKKKVAKKPKVKVTLKKKVAKKAAAKCNLSKNGRCGPKFGNTICPSGYCSKWWWCGTSALHKSTHQAKYDAKPACAAKKAVKKAVKKVKVTLKKKA